MDEARQQLFAGTIFSLNPHGSAALRVTPSQLQQTLHAF
jgi:hypothetical protein